VKYLYGYRFGEVDLPEFEGVRQDAVIKYNKMYGINDDIRRPMKINLGCAIRGFTGPHPDISHGPTAVRGVCKRFLRHIPSPEEKLYNRFSSFVDKWIETNLTPLAPETDVSFPTWIEHTPYPAWRKEELRRKNEAIINPYDKRYFNVKSFIKDESYSEFKHARAINSRTDEFKTLIGPWFKVIEKILFDPDRMPWFIKKIPVKDRPAYIINRLGRNARQYIATDYTAYESHFTARQMRSCEFKLYKYLTKNIPSHEQFWWYLENVLAGLNVCEFKWFTVQCMATRMSGEMNTSLGNGFANLMFMLFMLEDVYQLSDIVGVVEGDDGLFTASGELPSDKDFEKSFSQIGLTIKLELHDAIETASFCGLIFDKEDLANVTDPIAELGEFGWTTWKYMNAKGRRLKELLKAKSLSLLYQYPGCPIISALARYGLRCTRGVRIGRLLEGNMSQWEREQLLEAIKHRAVIDKPVGMNTRFLVEKKYGVLVEHQIAIERYLDQASFGELDIPLANLYSNTASREYWTDYQSVGGDLERPILKKLLKLSKPATLRIGR
jgi:hypothetical protein